MTQLVLGYSPYGGADTSCFPFDQVFDSTLSVGEEGAFDKIHALVLWGGMDIHPSFYKKQAHPANQASSFPSRRDEFEWKAMLQCKMRGIPIIGVCRGAQFLCAFAGGTLIQHVSGHQNGHHAMMTVDGEEIDTSSCHHQMMYPWDIPHKMLAWSKTRRSDRYEGEKRGEEIKEMKTLVEPECVYFPEIKGLGIQGHPEWMREKDRMVVWFNEQIIDYLFNDVKETV